MRKRVYVAGSYSADNVLKVFDNMRIGIRASTEIMLAGYSPFCPWIDYHFSLSLRDDEELTLKDFYDYSLAWLAVSDALYVLPNSEKSIGTQAEIRLAKELNIPIVYSMEDLDSLFNVNDEKFED